MANLGHRVSDQTVGNTLRRYGIQPAPKRSHNTTWKDFIARHMAVLAGTDFFTVEVLTWRGLATYYVLFFIHLESRRVSLAGLTKHPTAEWMIQMARNATDEGCGFLRGMTYLMHDRDTKYCTAFLDVLRSSGIRPLALPPRSPNLNAFAERWVCSLRQECLSKLILFGETSLRRALTEYIEHHHFERNHRVKAIFSFSLLQTYGKVPSAGPFAVATGSAAYLSSTPESLDYLTTRYPGTRNHDDCGSSDSSRRTCLQRLGGGNRASRNRRIEFQCLALSKGGGEYAHII
jgi:hypothetical protein